MPTYNPKIVIGSAPGITGHLYMSLAEATSPNVSVANSGQFAPPHGSSRQLTFNGLNPVVHICTLYETDGASTTGVIRAQFQIDPQFPGVELKADMFIYAGVTAGFAVGDNKFVSPTNELNGWTYSLEIPTYGTLDPATEYSVDSDNNPIIGLPSYQTQDGEKWVLKFQPKAITYNPTANPSGGGNQFTGELVIDADYSILDTEVGNIFHLASSSSTLLVILPPLVTVATLKTLPFISEGGNHKQVVIRADGSDKIVWLGEERTEIYLGQSEVIHLYKSVIDPNDPTTARWRVMHDGTDANKVGEKVYLDEIPDPTDERWRNCVFANGSLLDRDQFPRLWAYVQQLDPSMLVTDAAWNTADEDGIYTNRGKYSTGNGSSTFRVPKLFETGFLRGVDGTTKVAGAYEGPMLLEHQHETQAGAVNPTLFGRGQTRQIGYYNGQGSGPTDLTSKPTDASGVELTNIGDENRPANIAQYILIRA